MAALDQIIQREDEFDVVVIIRGGGATSDLSGFDTYLLAAACAQFPLPIITGIGHERDETVLDAVSHTRVKTPTAAAEYLVNKVDEATKYLDMLAAQLRESVMVRLESETNKLLLLKNRIPSLAIRKLTEAKYELKVAEKGLLQTVSSLLMKKKHQLELLKQRISTASPDELLKRGYSITLKDGKVVTDSAQVKAGDVLVTRLAKGEVNSEVI